MASPTEETGVSETEATEVEENEPQNTEGDVLKEETEQESESTEPTEPERQRESDEPYPNTASKSGGVESENAAGQDDNFQRNAVQAETARKAGQKHETNPELDPQTERADRQPKGDSDPRQERDSGQPEDHATFHGKEQKSDPRQSHDLDQHLKQESHPSQEQKSDQHEAQDGKNKHLEQDSHPSQKRESDRYQDQESGHQEQGAEPHGDFDTNSDAALLPEKSSGNEDKPEDTRKYKIFVIGKTGTGKSTLCNRIIGRDVFATGRSFSRVTTKTQAEKVTLSELDITVVDTPDISTESETTQENIVKMWKESAKGYNYMIVLTVRCDTRYSPAEYEVYKQIKQLWGNDLCKRLVVAFTFGDAREDQNRDMGEELKEVWEELKHVMKDADDRYVVFNNKPGRTDDKSVGDLIYIMQRLKDGERCKWAVGIIFVTLLGCIGFGGLVVLFYKTYELLSPSRALGAVQSYLNGTEVNNSLKNESIVFPS